MRQKVVRLFGLWAFDREERWLNEMAAKGLSLVSVRWPGSYEFEQCAPGEHIVRLELLEQTPGHPESEQYIRFLEETGAEYIGSILRWVYFRKRNKGEGFDLHSDMDSRIRHLRRIALFALPFAFMLWCTGGMNVIHNITQQGGITANIVLGASNILLAALFTYTYVKLALKIRALKRERQLHE